MAGATEMFFSGFMAGVGFLILAFWAMMHFTRRKK